MPSQLTVDPDGSAACHPATELGFEFSLAFQPIVESGTGTVFAQEALVRGVGGEGSASVVTNVNNDNLHHFDQACRTAAIRLASELELEQLLSINVMANAVYKPEQCLRSTVRAAEESGFPLNRIIFEIPESEDATDVDHVRNTIEAHQAFGMRTALNDVGAGHAGLNLMVDLKTDFLKADRHLIHNIDTDPRRRAAVAGLVQISKALGSRLIAQGIETRSELITVLSLGIDLVQGFFIARPQFEGFAAISPDAWELLRLHGRSAAHKPPAPHRPQSLTHLSFDAANGTSAT